MSGYSYYKRFNHANDCSRYGCPGHVLRLRHNGFDCVEIYIDEVLQKTFDDGTFEAIIAADEERDDKLPCVKPSSL